MGRPLKIVLVCYRDDARGGGTVRVAMTLSNALVKLGHQVTLAFAYGGPGPITAGSMAQSVFFEASGAKDLKTWKRVWSWFRQHRADVVHFVDVVNWMTIVAALAGQRTIQHIHGRPLTSHWNKIDKWFAKLRKFWVKHTLCISEATKATMIRERMAFAGTSHVLYNAIDVDHWTQKVPASKLEGIRYIGQVARMVEANGCLETLEVLRYLPEQWHLLLAGDGPILPAVKAKAAELQLSHRLQCVGSVDDPRSIYQQLDAVLMLAQYQPFCLMIAEAMASKVPVFGLYGEGEYCEPQRPLLCDSPFFLHRKQSPWHWREEPAETYQRLANLLQQRVGHPGTLLRLEQDYNHVKQFFDAPIQAREYVEWIERCRKS